MPDYSHAALVKLPDAALETLFRASHGPKPGVLAGYEWRGFNTPWWTGTLGIQKFIKGFWDTGNGVEGYNIRVRQNGYDAPWIQQPSAEAPKAFGFFTVTEVDASSRENHHADATLLDYGASTRNDFSSVDNVVMRALRDYVVQPDPANPDVMLGKALIALGPARVFSNFFVIERLRPGVWKP